MVIVIDVGVHRGQEMRLLLGDGYSIFFKQILVTCWNELKAGHLRELRPFLIDALKLLSSFGSALAHQAPKASRAAFGEQVGRFAGVLKAAIDEVDAMAPSAGRKIYAQRLLPSATATV